MHRFTRWLICLGIGVALPVLARADDYSIKQAQSPAPKEVRESIRKLLNDSSIQLLGPNGSVISEVWFRKEVPVKATPDQVRNGLTYREVEESTVLGAIRFDQAATDYRKQKIKPGVYTFRLGFQPMDGDHMGTAPYTEFCLLLPANLDEKPDLIETKELREMSAKSVGTSHPGVLLLFPNEKPSKTPLLVSKGNNTWVLTLAEPVTVDGKSAGDGLGIGLALVGHTTME
jgi:hypothetical protein